jgi:hypothetical protein
MTADELVTRVHAEHAALEQAIASLDDTAMCAPLVDGWSIKDVLAHLATWERRVMRAITAADRGEEIAWPEPGFEMHETDRLNERDFLSNRDRTLKDVRDAARASLDEYVRWITTFDDDQLERERPYLPGITLTRVIRGNGELHVAQHRLAIEARLAQADGA